MSHSADPTSVLLPPSGVDFFVLNAETEAVTRKLAEDWRFARVNVQVEHAGIDAALERYAHTPSPELIIVETDDIGEGFIEKLGALAGLCKEGTDAIVVGPTNDVRLYRSLVGMGVKDYLVRPLAEADLAAVVAKSLVEKRGLSGACLIAVVGGKGGVGATAVAQVAAWIAAETLKHKTVLLDLAGSNSTLGVSYGMEPSAIFSEAVRLGAEGSEDDMRRLMQSAGENLSLLVCGGDPILSARPSADGIEALVTRLMKKAPVVVVDLSGASRAVQKRIIGLASCVFMVTTPMLSALRNTRTYMGEIKNARQSLDKVSLVVNMTGIAGAEEVGVKDIEAALGKAPGACLPFAPKIFLGSEASGKPVGQDKNAGDILNALLPAVAHAIGVEAKAEAGGHKDDLFAALKKKLAKK